MVWSDKKHYQKFTYANLIMCGELLGITYDDAKDVKMPELIFYPTGANSDIVDNAADMMSERLDRRFSNDGNAEYEAGVTSEIARQKLKEVLKDSVKTVENLAEEVNNNYKFSDES